MLLGRHETDTATQLRSYATLSLYMLLLRPNASSGSTMDLVYDGSGNLANIDPWRSKKLHEFRTEQKVVFFARCRPTTTNKQQPRTKPLNIYAYSICLSLFIIVKVHFASVFNFRIRSWLSKNWHAKKCGWKLKVAIFKIKKKTGKLFENWKLSKAEIFGVCICLLFSMHFRRWWTDSDFNGKNLKSRRKTGLGGWLNLCVSLVLRSGIRGRHSMVAPFLKLVSS